MHDVVFESTLLRDGHLSCPAEYASPKAAYKVIATIPESDAGDGDVEIAAAADAAEEALSSDEVRYYLNLDEPS